MTVTAEAPATTVTTHLWLALRCPHCTDGSYARTTGYGASWRCERCGQAADATTLRTADADALRTDTGDLLYGIPTTATFTFARPDERHGHAALHNLPKRFTTAELFVYLTEICDWDSADVDRALIDAARTGTSEHLTKYGLRTVLIRRS